MATEVERLAVLIEANTKSYERAMARMEQRTAQAINRSTKSVKQLDSSIKGLAARGTSLLAAFGIGVGGLGVAALADFFKRTFAEADRLVDLSDKVGITVDQLQELNYHAELNASSAEAMGDAISYFARQLGTAATKGGELADILALNGIALRDEQGELIPVMEQLEAYADLVANAGSETERIRLATVAFGRSADELAVTFASGRKGIQASADELDRLGGKVSEIDARRLAEINDEFARLMVTAEGFGKHAVTAAVNSLTAYASGIEQLGAATRKFWSDPSIRNGLEALAGRDVAQALSPELQERVDRINAEIAELEAAKASAGATANSRGIADGMLTRLRQELAALNAELAVTSARLQGVAQAAGYPQLSAQRYDPLSSANSGLPAPLKPPQTKLPVDSSGASAAASRADAIQDVIDNLRFEQEQLGRTAREQAIYNEINRAGVDINSAQGQQIAGLAGGLYDMEQALDRNIERWDMIRDAAEGVFNSVIDGAREGKSAVEIFDDVLDGVLDTLQKVIVQQAIAGLLGDAGNAGPGFGGGIPLPTLRPSGRARGGPISGGTPYMVGERGPELIVPRSSGMVVPNHALGGGRTTVQVIDQRKGGAPVERQSQRGPNGEELIRLIVRDELGSPRTGKMLRTSYGVEPVMTRR